MRFVRKAARYAKRHVVLCVAMVAAIISCFFVPPSADYLNYFDWKTLTCLFITLAVVNALRDIKFFTISARRMIMLTGNLRTLCLALIDITFLGSMLIANDMALITFLPLGYFALSVTKKEKYAAFVFILQNIAANLGGMLTPFGNPQNLYLYSRFEIPTGEFMWIMLPPFVLAVAMLTICCFFLPKEKLTITEAFPEKLNVKRTCIYGVLFAFTILIVFRLIPYYFGLVLVPLILFFMDREALKAVDYALLATFFFFFLFSGNVSRIPAVSAFLGGLLNRNALLVSTLSCQVISNVPTAILLSGFTTSYRELLLGVNIGGTGTLIASLASLITYSEYKKLYPGKGKTYLGLFTLLNVVFLAILYLFVQFVPFA